MQKVSFHGTLDWPVEMVMDAKYREVGERNKKDDQDGLFPSFGGVFNLDRCGRCRSCGGATTTEIQSCKSGSDDEEKPVQRERKKKRMISNLLYQYRKKETYEARGSQRWDGGKSEW